MLLYYLFIVLICQINVSHAIVRCLRANSPYIGVEIISSTRVEFTVSCLTNILIFFILKFILSLLF
jgi:hypothetical protein